MGFVFGELGFYCFINVELADRVVYYGSVSCVDCVCIGGNEMNIMYEVLKAVLIVVVVFALVNWYLGG